jgi:tripeptide aminopeptidase
MKWNTLLSRHGFKLSDLEGQDWNGNTISGFLSRSLSMVEGMNKNKDQISEQEWLNILQEVSSKMEGYGGETLIDSSLYELPLMNIDPYIRGIVRWLTELGMYTVYSCDGHNRRSAYVYTKHILSFKQMNIIRACSVPGISVRFDGKKITFQYDKGEAFKLLDIAERLHTLTVSPEQLAVFEAEQFKPSLVELLSISGSSGNERNIRRHLERILRRKADYSYVDRAGNLLSYLYCGEGPTVLLSAHMDTTEEFVPGRRILENGTVLSSSEGILGADDRAGIAVILEVLSLIHKTNFKGTLKIAFTTKEEIGCVGSRTIDQEFIQDVDAAIVVDRRGHRDIVTSNGATAFCPEHYGLLFEEAGRLAGMEDWKVTPGGISDAKVFASYGIPSVNLSVGYMNEHTDFETVDYMASYETVKLVEAILHWGLTEKFKIDTGHNRLLR